MQDKLPHRFLLEVVLTATPKHNQGTAQVSHTPYLCWQTKIKNQLLNEGRKKDNLLVTQNVSTIGNRGQIIIKLTEMTVNLGRCR